MKKEEKVLKCSICGKSTTRLVDGEPSCDEHAGLVYENQVEDYTKRQIDRKDWLEG
ncbi:MAG TPA: hypothetical protein VFA68_17645 [Terriglobales bacterium]|nr:hypothetical protein [Terriglobales bacterium]